MAQYKTILALVLALVGCGGSAQKTYVGMYGDSVSWGSCAICPTYRLEIPPVRQLNELAKSYEVLDYSLPGATVLDTLNGGYGLPFDNFNEQIAKSPEKITLLRFGGADALLNESEIDFRQGLTQLITLAKSKEKVVVLTGIVWTSTPDIRLDNYNAIIKEIAVTQSVPFLDLRSIAYSPANSIDGLHPNQEYSYRISTLISETLNNLVKYHGISN
jgi:GDSL-like Lipase/Acylhydrolase family